jgi:hypothetical protein
LPPRTSRRARGAPADGQRDAVEREPRLCALAPDRDSGRRRRGTRRGAQPVAAAKSTAPAGRRRRGRVQQVEEPSRPRRPSGSCCGPGRGFSAVVEQEHAVMKARKSPVGARP